MSSPVGLNSTHPRPHCLPGFKNESRCWWGGAYGVELDVSIAEGSSAAALGPSAIYDTVQVKTRNSNERVKTQNGNGGWYKERRICMESRSLSLLLCLNASAPDFHKAAGWLLQIVPGSSGKIKYLIISYGNECQIWLPGSLKRIFMTGTLSVPTWATVTVQRFFQEAGHMAQNEYLS